MESVRLLPNLPENREYLYFFQPELTHQGRGTCHLGLGPCAYKPASVCTQPLLNSRSWGPLKMLIQRGRACPWPPVTNLDVVISLEGREDTCRKPCIPELQVVASPTTDSHCQLLRCHLKLQPQAFPPRDQALIPCSRS